MAVCRISSGKSQKISRGFRRALASAVFEWLLIFMLFIHAIFSYVLTKFAQYCELQTPCLLCSRLDHALGNKKLKFYWDLICGNHKLEISSLVFCHAHNKLVDVHGMCESCLFSFATINKSNAETYRLLVGKLGEKSSFSFNEEPSVETQNFAHSVTRHCPCCNEPWISTGYAQNLMRCRSGGSEAAELDMHGRSDKQTVSDAARHPENTVVHPLPHIGYKELEVDSDTESEAACSDADETTALLHETNGSKEDHAIQSIHLQPRLVHLSDDSVTEKLIDPASAPEPSVLISDRLLDLIKHHRGELLASAVAVGHGWEELNWQQVDCKDKSSALPEIIFLEDAPPSSNVRESLLEDSKESKCLPLDDIPPSPNVNGGPLGVLEEGNTVLLDDAPPSSNDAESLAEASKGTCVGRTLEVGEPTVTECEDNCQITSGQDTSKPDTCGTPPSGVTGTVEVGELTVPEYEDICQNTSGLSGSLRGANMTPLSGLARTVEVGEQAVPECDDICQNTSGSNAGLPDTSMTPLSGVARTIEVGELTVAESEEICQHTSGLSTSLPDTNMTSLSAVARTVEVGEPTVPEAEDICQNTSGLITTETALEANPSSSDSSMHVPSTLDLSDAYKLAVGSRGKQQSGLLSDQWMGKDSSRVSEDLKYLLSQLSAARGIEQSPSDISPKMSVKSDDFRTSDAAGISGLQLLQRRISLERNESNLSLDGSIVSEIEGESEVDRLKRQVEHDRKLLSTLYKELEEERNASAVAVNQAMAMITRLQEEKATLHMEALQNLRMMEEQAEYDMEALQKTNDLLAEKEKEIQDLEAELELFKSKFHDESELENASELYLKAKESEEDYSEATCVKESADDLIPSVTEKPNISNKVEKIDMSSMDVNKGALKNLLLGFEDERLYILQYLKKLEDKLSHFSGNGICSDLTNGECFTSGGDRANTATDGNELSMQNNKSAPEVSPVTKSEFDLTSQGIHAVYRGTDLASLGIEVSELNESLEALRADQYFLEHSINSLRSGEDGLQFIQQIATHLQALRRIGTRITDQTVA